MSSAIATPDSRPSSIVVLDFADWSESQPSSPTRTPFPFFHLPYELRCEIYRKLLPDASSSWARGHKVGLPQSPGPLLSHHPPEYYYAAVKRRHREKQRQFSRRQNEGKIDQTTNDVRGLEAKLRDPRPKPFTPENIPPGRELLFVSKQIYREFAPLWYSNVCKNLAFKGYRAGVPVEIEGEHEDWGLDHLETMVSPRSPGLTLDRNGLLPIHFCETIFIYIPTPTTSILARRWLFAMARLEEITSQGQKSGFSKLKHLKIKFWRGMKWPERQLVSSFAKPDWDGRIDTDIDSNNAIGFEIWQSSILGLGASITTTATTTTGTGTQPHRRVVTCVELESNTTFAKIICRFHGLEKLSLQGFSGRHWPQILDDNMLDPTMALLRAGDRTEVGWLKRETDHDWPMSLFHDMWTMYATWERRDKFAGQGDLEARQKLYEDHVIANRGQARMARPFFLDKTLVEVAKR